ncbi:molybdate ABC transporter substrate-binding protein [Demequina subtropica]|uniref:molybdate ABC transporter substrate-binding protein n=1 Tax=Demequina subtropica TaxID=1638989 RepID=UPI0007867E95|nr:molybdate ABC transporter substrate-binding protein [Demequina subtropica]
MRLRALAALGVACAAALSACAADAAEGDTLTVLAAASLAEVLEPIAASFEDEHPGVDVIASYAGSSDLAAQILEGAPADVFASADEATMDKVADLVTGTPVVFATNTLTIAVPSGNPAVVATLADLADPGIVSVICAPQVPCGTATASLAALAGVTLTPASEEANVTDVLGKVASGQADAGIVYVTDVARSEGVEAVPIEGAEAVVNRYPAAALASSDTPELATAFVDHLSGEAAREALAAAGFGIP